MCTLSKDHSLIGLGNGESEEKFPEANQVRSLLEADKITLSDDVSMSIKLTLARVLDSPQGRHP